MFSIPSYYKADDLYLQFLYDEGCKVCQGKMTPMPERKIDTFNNKTQKTKERIKTGAKIGGLLGTAALIGYGIMKMFAKKKHVPVP